MMIRLTLAFSLLACIVGLPLVGCEEKPAARTPPMIAPETTPADVMSQADSAATAAAIKCIVSGDDANPKLTAEYQGKAYFFCCNDCKEAFDKAPEKFAKN